MLSIEKYVYPPSRTLEDPEGRKKGVAGSLEMLNDRKIAEQPIVGFDWNADKIGLGISRLPATPFFLPSGSSSVLLGG